MTDGVKEGTKLILSEKSLEEAGSLQKMMNVISSNPRLAARYIEALERLEKDNEYHFTTIEKDMFVSMKVMFDEVYERAMTEPTVQNFGALAKLTSQIYESLQESLSKAKLRERPPSVIGKLKKMTVETDEQVATLEVMDKTDDAVDVDARDTE